MKINKMATKYKNRKGVQTIHLFNDVWRIGRLTYMKGTKRPHCVIYSPADTQHDVYDNEALNLRSDNCNIRATRADLAKVKIYILTSILDKRENWTYDLTSMPELESIVKIIYDNGTIKNILFGGNFESISIPNNGFDDNGKKIEYDKQYYKTVQPVCWRNKI